MSGSVLVTASASDETAVVGVQLQLDGQPLGAEITSAPYRVTWDTTSSANGGHELTAVARDAAGNRTTATSVTVTVSNALPAIRRIQSTSGSGAPTSAVTLTLPTATTTGNMLIVAVSDYYATADPDTTISDSRTNTWKVAVNYANGARVKVYYAENISGGANHQITVRTDRRSSPISSRRLSNTQGCWPQAASTAWRRLATRISPTVAAR